MARHTAAMRRWLDSTGTRGARKSVRASKAWTWEPRGPGSRVDLGAAWTWEPVSGIEPLTCRLQDGCSAN